MDRTFFYGHKKKSNMSSYIRICRNRMLTAEIALVIGLEALNVGILVWLASIYYRSYSKIKSGFTISLLIFSLLILLESVVAIVLFATTEICSIGVQTEKIRPFLSVIELAGLIALLRASTR